MSRKYGQRGYRESEREGGETRRNAPVAPRAAVPERPRGRGLGAPDAQIFRCAVCGDEAAAPASPDAVCAKCGAALRSCTHCQHFDSGARWECRQPVAVRVAKKSARNECPSFAARIAVEHAREKVAARDDDPRAAFDALFKL